MDEVRIRNMTRGTVLGDRVGRATSFGDRLVGLLGRAALPEGEGLWLEPCNSVHMWFMRFPIDVVFASASGEVVALAPELRPWSATVPKRGARAALELPVGAIARSGTCIGDRLVQEPACA